MTQLVDFKGRRSFGEGQGPALVSNLLCRGQEKYTMHQTVSQIENPGQIASGTFDLKNLPKICAVYSGTAEGIFINNTPAADILGSGDFSDFEFHINSSDERTGTLDAGTYTYEGSRDQADVVRILGDRGAFSYLGENQFGNPYHPGDLNFRFSSGASPVVYDYGPSPHLLVPQDPGATVPVGPGYTGDFHVDSHTGTFSHGECAFFHVGCQ